MRKVGPCCWNRDRHAWLNRGVLLERRWQGGRSSMRWGLSQGLRVWSHHHCLLLIISENRSRSTGHRFTWSIIRVSPSCLNQQNCVTTDRIVLNDLWKWLMEHISWLAYLCFFDFLQVLECYCQVLVLVLCQIRVLDVETAANSFLGTFTFFLEEQSGGWLNDTCKVTLQLAI